MRIGVVTTSFPRFPGDPAGHFVRRHAQWMIEAGHQVEVLCAGGGTGGRAAHGGDDDAAEPGLRVERLGVGGSLFYRGGAPDRLEVAPRSWAAAAVFSARLAAAARWRARRWDAVVAHWWLPSAAAVLPTGLRGAAPPLLAIAHSGDIHLARRLGVLGLLTRRLLRRSARLVFVNQALAELAAASLAPRERAAFWEATLILSMGVEVPARVHRAPPPAVPMVLFLGRLVPVKGLQVLLEACARAHTPWKLVIAGDGPLAPEVAAAAAARPARIEWLGQVRTDERDGLLASASCVVIPSQAVGGGRQEGMPLAALEALAAGVPLLVSASGGLAELPDEVCRKVAAADPAAWALAIDETLGALGHAGPGQGASEPDRRAQAGRAWVSDRSWPVVGAKLWHHAHFESDS